MTDDLSLNELRDAVARTAAAFRCVTEYQPVGGEGDKVFPPTYEGGRYATEKRRLPGESDPVDCVLLDSVQSQANRMELALLAAWEANRLQLPVVTVDFSKHGLSRSLRVTSLEAPHRIADALIRDSRLNGTLFRKSELGKRLDHVDCRNATALFELCPTALIFGMWDSTGPRGGAGAKFQRAVVSEIIGVNAVVGARTSSRIDPAQIVLGAGPLYRSRANGEALPWTLDPDLAETDKKSPVKLGKDGRPSEANHGNITPTIAEGGITISRAIQTTTISLAALRRLRFPVEGETNGQADVAARTALAALALCAATLVRELGADLRSRCQLFACTPFIWELLDRPAEPPRQFALSADIAVAIYREAVREAIDAGLPWQEEEVVLEPDHELVELVRRSQEALAAAPTAAEV